MKNYWPKILSFLLILLIGLSLATPIYAQTAAGVAGKVAASFLGFSNSQDMFTSLVTEACSLLLKVAAWFVTLTAMLLNVSMYATTHLQTFIDKTPVIYTIWQIIRDLASLYLIFMILNVAIRMIIGKSTPNTAEIIKNIVIIGILINFSFFITRAGIDLSNIVSLQFFNAIAPSNSAAEVMDASDGGLADIFMNSFKVTAWYDGSGEMSAAAQKESGGGSTLILIKIILISVGGMVVMILASISFAIAAAACLFRIVVLLFLLALSPIWMASMVIPDLSIASKKWISQFKSQLLFLPVYLGFMYIAIRIMTESQLNKLVAADTSAVALGQFINLFVGFAIVLFMVNTPFFAAISIAGGDLDWTSKYFKKATDWTKGQLKKRSSAAGSAAWSNSIGRIASSASENESFRNFAARNKIGEYALKSTRSISKGYDEKLKGQVSERTKFAESLGYNRKRVVDLQRLIREEEERKIQARRNGLNTDQFDKNIKGYKAEIDNLKNERQTSYADRINTGSLDTLYLKVARKDKVAAAKIHIEIKKKKVEKENKALEKIRDDIKKTKDQIQNLEDTIMAQPGGANTNQSTRLAELKDKLDNPDPEKGLYVKEENKLAQVTELEEQLSEFEKIS